MELTVTLLPQTQIDDDWAIEQAGFLEEDIHFYQPELKAKRLEKEIQPGQAGGAFDAIVKILFGKNFTDNVLDIFKTWITNRGSVIAAKKPKIQINLKDEKGNEKIVVLEGNFKNPNELIDQLKSVLQVN